MNLIQNLPSNVIIDGFEVSINTSFKASIQFESLFKENLEDEEFRKRALKIYYPVIPKNINEAIKAMLWFYRCGKEQKEDEEQQAPTKENVYSFEFDADYIYSAFLDQYRIDLQECNDLHWWKFKALFKALKEDNEINRIMSIRATNTSGMKGKELEHYRKLKKIYAIPRPKEEIESKNALEDALMNGGNISTLLGN